MYLFMYLGYEKDILLYVIKSADENVYVKNFLDKLKNNIFIFKIPHIVQPGHFRVELWSF